jgi:hypothetical protein
MICQMNNPLAKQNDCSPAVVLEKNELWDIDLVGPIDESEEGHKYILTMIYYCMKWVEAAPL